MRPLRGLGWGGSLYAVAMVLAAALMVPVGWAMHPVPLDPQHLLLLALLAVLVQVSALMPIRFSRGVLTVDTLPLTAAGLLFPGAGVALLAWMFTFDGRRPGPGMPVWRLGVSRAKIAVEHGMASLIAAAIPISSDWLRLPLRTGVYACVSLVLTYVLVARMFAFLERLPFHQVLAVALRQTSVQSVFLLVFGGGVLAILLMSTPGRLMSIAVLGFLFAIRANIADAQRQREAKVQTLTLAAQALDARDRYTESHSQRVSELSVQLGQALGLPTRDVERLRVGGILHDIGKIGIPDAILNKRGPLTPFEWAIMRRHSDLGADMILSHSALADVAPMVRHHHERWDGGGYPAGLEGEEIPLGGRILAVADSFDTITRIRIYRRNLLTTEQAVDDISRLSGSWYDPAVVNALRAIHQRQALPVPAPAPAAVQAAAPAPSLAHGLGLVGRSAGFRRLVTASGISSLGDPLTTVAVLVTAYVATHSALAVAGTYIAKAVATLLVGGALAGISDHFDRRRLIFTVEVGRACVLLATPALLGVALAWLFPVVFLLAAAEAVVAPAREAATPQLVAPGELRDANAVLGAVTTSAQVIGFPLAGLVLAAGGGTTPLFWLDGATFLVGGAVILTISGIGGAVGGTALRHGLRRAWAIRPARPYLAVTGISALFIAMAMPGLIALAYELARSGAQAYALLELALSIGVVAGNVILWRVPAIRPVRLMALGLGVTALFCIGIAFSRTLLLSAVLLLLASVGNAWYFVANRTGLQEVGRGDRLGSLMATRFTVGNLMLIVGAGIGGYLVQAVGPRVVYGLIGIGLGSVAVAVAVGFARRPASRTVPVPEERVTPGLAPAATFSALEQTEASG